MSRYIYIPNRVLNKNGVADGAMMFFYASGSTTLIDVYSDLELTTPLPNPYTVGMGAPVPEIYWDGASMRVLVIGVDGEVISDDDPYSPVGSDAISRGELASPSGAHLVGFKRSSLGAEETTEGDRDELEVYLFDFIPSGNHAAIMNGTDTNAWDAEIQKFLDALAAEKRYLGRIGSGFFNLASGVSALNGLRLAGDVKGGTRFIYSGTGSCLKFQTPGSIRGYSSALSDILIIKNGARAGIGLDLISCSEGDFERIICAGFDKGVALHSAISGGAVYNHFNFVKGQNCNTGIHLYRDDDGAGSTSSYTNDNIFWGCRANGSDVGLHITGGNHNVFAAGQIEVCDLGFKIEEPVTASTAANTISHTRFENNVQTGYIGAGVVYTVLDDPAIFSNTGATIIEDLGTRTQRIGNYGTLQHHRQSVAQNADGSFRFSRTANGGAQTPNMLVDDQSTINSGVVIESRSVATSKDARLFRGKYGATPKFGVVPISGKLTDFSTVNGPVGSFTMTTASGTLVVSNTCISTNSNITLQPYNAAAASLVADKGVYISARTADTSFTVSTGDGSPPPASALFGYWIVN